MQVNTAPAEKCGVRKVAYEMSVSTSNLHRFLTLRIDSKMFLLLLLPVLLVSHTNSEDFFPILAQRYCEKRCHVGGINFKSHVCCDSENTKVVDGMTIFNSNVEFRQGVLNKLNEFRNKLAEGQMSGFPSASNMLALNYDVGLEHSAYCAIKANKLLEGDDVCIGNKYDEELSVFPTMINPSKPVNLANVNEALNLLQEHLDYVKDLTEDMIKNHDPKIGTNAHYIYLVTLTYSMFNKVGCARYMNPKEKIANIRYIVYCVLAPTQVWGKFNYFNAPHYKSGSKCSDCPLKKFYEPEELKCGSKYTALCGEVKPVPTYTWGQGSLVDEPWLEEEWYNE